MTLCQHTSRYSKTIQDQSLLTTCPFPSPWHRSASSETAENYMLDLDSPASTLLSVCPRQFGIHYDIDHCMGSLAQSPSNPSKHLVNTNKPLAVKKRKSTVPFPSFSIARFLVHFDGQGWCKDSWLCFSHACKHIQMFH